MSLSSIDRLHSNITYTVPHFSDFYTRIYVFLENTVLFLKIVRVIKVIN